MYENKQIYWDIWRTHYISPDTILPIEKRAFVVKNDECWDEKFDTGFSDRTEALLIAAHLQIVFQGKYGFTVRPDTYKPPFVNAEETRRMFDIFQYLEAILKPKENVDQGEYYYDEEEYVSEEDEEFAREQAIAEANSEIFLDRKFEKFDYYEGSIDLETDP
jgi:hypothetical protein